MPRQRNTASGRWFDTLPAVSAEIPCGGETHRFTWRRGKVVLEDHDILAEQSLTALGAKPPVCLQVLEAWRAMRDSTLVYELLLRDSMQPPELLAVMKATHEDRIGRAQEMPQRVGARLRKHPEGAQILSELQDRAAERVAREKRRWATAVIKALPAALKRALGLSVIVNVARHWDEDAYRREHVKHIEPALTAIATPLFEHSARQWRRNLKPYARIEAEASLLGPREPPKCTARADSGGAHAVLALPISWFTDVWSRGIALVDHCFVMGLAESVEDEMELRVHAVRWERRGWESSSSAEAPALVTRGRRGNWRLHWL